MYSLAVHPLLLGSDNMQIDLPRQALTPVHFGGSDRAYVRPCCTQFRS